MLINERYLVNYNTMSVTDMYNDIHIKLEPRLMKLLLLFAENTGVLVSREKIINDIWDNYGGAEEGLNQAVSFLRKTFNDSDKTLIKTIPKNGYIFDVRISYNKDKVGSGKKRWIRLTLILLLFIVAVALFFYKPLSKTGPASEPHGTVIDSGYPSKERKELQYNDSMKHK